MKVKVHKLMKVACYSPGNDGCGRDRVDFIACKGEKINENTKTRHWKKFS